MRACEHSSHCVLFTLELVPGHVARAKKTAVCLQNDHKSIKVREKAENAEKFEKNSRDFSITNYLSCTVH